MRFSLSILAALLLVTGFVSRGEAGDEASRLESYSLTDLDGDARTLAEYRGEVVVVNFWASWCAPCRKELPTLDAWNTEWSSRGARVAAISVDSDPDKARRFAEEAELGLELYHDGPDGLAKQLDLPYLPCTYVLDANGELVLVTGGSGEEELARVHRTVEQLLAGSAAMSPMNASSMEGTR
jgi:thiol-disulfide isomerase/thioredoxin